MTILNAHDNASYQSGIDNSKVESDIVITKISEGTNYLNPARDSQITSALRGNKLIGLYHFARGGDYIAEANFFLRNAKPYLKNAVLFLDYEGGVVPVGKADYAEKWLDYVYKCTGTKPMIYIGLADENMYQWDRVARKYCLWVAQYDTMAPQYGYTPNKKLTYGKVNHWPQNKIAMYQYTPNGYIKGYSGPLDLSAYYGTKATWTNHSDNDIKGEYKEMEWHPKVNALDMGVFMVTKKGKTTTVWDSPDIATRKDTGQRLENGRNYIIFGDKNGFFKLGKNQWVDSATGVVKKNKLYFYAKANCTCIVERETRGYASTTGKATGRTFKKGEKYKTFGYVDGFLQIGAGKDKFIPAKDVKIIL